MRVVGKPHTIVRHPCPRDVGTTRDMIWNPHCTYTGVLVGGRDISTREARVQMHGGCVRHSRQGSIQHLGTQGGGGQHMVLVTHVR